MRGQGDPPNTSALPGGVGVHEFPGKNFTGETDRAQRRKENQTILILSISPELIWRRGGFMVNRPICRSVDISRREAGEPRKGLVFDF